MRLIDVEKVIGDLTAMKREYHAISIEGMIKGLEEVPTIEAEPVKHGQWVHNEEYEYWAERYVCSVCNRNALSDGDYRHKLADYCPNCGAKMDSEGAEIK